MFNYFLMGLSLLMMSSVSADANIKDEAASRTFLLTAPGTISGVIKEEGERKLEANRQFLRPGEPEFRTPQPPQQRPQRYNYVGENYNFPQYGRERGQNNPWLGQRSNRRMSPPPPNSYSSNPWDLGDSNSFDARRYQSSPYSNYPGMNQPGMNQGFSQYGNTDNFQPDFPDGIFRDSNPAATMPFMNGMMPGLGGNSLGGNNFGMPFSPFGMF